MEKRKRQLPEGEKIMADKSKQDKDIFKVREYSFTSSSEDTKENRAYAKKVNNFLKNRNNELNNELKEAKSFKEAANIYLERNLPETYSSMINTMKESIAYGDEGFLKYLDTVKINFNGKNRSFSYKKVAEDKPDIKDVAKVVTEQKATPDKTAVTETAVTEKPATKPVDLEKKTDEALEAEVKTEKTEDNANKASEMQRNIIGRNYDVYSEVNSPNWIWREVNDKDLNLTKAQKGYLIFQHIASTLGSAANGIANSWDGGSRDTSNNSYIKEMRQGKLQQLIKNRQEKQNTTNRSITDVIAQVTGNANEAYAAQARMENIIPMNLFNRLDTAAKIQLQAAIVSDNRGVLSDAMLGQVVQGYLNGEYPSITDAISAILTGSLADKDAVNTIKSNTESLVNKITESNLYKNTLGKLW